jgi:tetratricopeptide (TPR) repeat protein
MRIHLWLVFSLAVVFKAWPQTVLPDSILREFGNTPHDSSYVNQLNFISSGHLKTNPLLSRQIATHAGETAKSIGYTRGYARSLTVIGNSFWYEGIYEFAQNNYFLAARYYQDLNDSIGLGQVFNNIGEINKKLGQNDQALNYLLRSLSLRKNDTTLALTLYNIAELYFMQGKFDDATRYIKRSSEVAKLNHDERSLYYTFWLMAKINLKTRLFQEAYPFFQQAMDGWKKLEENRNLTQAYRDVAEAFRLQGNFAAAAEYLERAQETEKKINLPELRVQIYLEMAKLDSTRGNYQQAYYYMVRHTALKDSVYNILKAEQMAHVQAIYETDRRERENQQLRAETKLKEEELKSRGGLLVAISTGLLILIMLSVILWQQRFRILKNNKVLQIKNDEIKSQKESIEFQAVTLMKLNEELKQFNKTLENSVDERSRQLLVQNQKLAEYSFVNAHKLRAPVASILGLIQLLDQATPDERDVILKHLKTCAVQLDVVIQEISRSLASK